jgi:hypothetical protein
MIGPQSSSVDDRLDIGGLRTCSADIERSDVTTLTSCAADACASPAELDSNEAELLQGFSHYG